jgi:uncharacterized protein YuzE
MRKKIFISYDKDADVMYLSFGKPTKAEGEEIDEGIFARYKPDTGELVGLTVINFSKKFGIEPKEVTIPIYT